MSERERTSERVKEQEKNFHRYFFSLYTYRVLAGGFMKSATVNMSDKFMRCVMKVLCSKLL